MIKSLHQARARVAAVAVAGLLAAPAFAATDTTSVTAAITEAATALAVVGAAYVAMRYGSAVWKWLTKFAG